MGIRYHPFNTGAISLRLTDAKINAAETRSFIKIAVKLCQKCTLRPSSIYRRCEAFRANLENSSGTSECTNQSCIVRYQGKECTVKVNLRRTPNIKRLLRQKRLLTQLNSPFLIHSDLAPHQSQGKEMCVCVWGKEGVKKKLTHCEWATCRQEATDGMVIVSVRDV